MAYIGVPPADRTSGARVRDEFTADGTQVCFQLSQEVPGSFESNIIAVVENVIQEPVSAYTIVDTVTLSLTSISGTFVLNETITGGTSAATGKVIKVSTGNIVIKTVSGTLTSTENITGGTSSATATITAKTTNIGKGLNFTGTPTNGSKIYVLHQASATYNLKPAVGSVTPESLSENLRTFTVDKFTATASQTAFTLTATPISVKSILVFVDGVMQTETTHYTLSGTTLTIGSALAVGQQVSVVHLGFSTVSRTAFVDGSVTTAMIADGAITADKIADGTIIAADVADSAITTNKIATGAITTAKIADSAVTSAKIADGTIALSDLSATGTKDATTFLRGDNTFAVVAVTPTAVSDQANTSTGYFDLPAGTTAQRPGSPNTGMSRYNSDTGFAEYYNGSVWVQYGNLSAPSVTYLVVAGGGGGGNQHGGGGGAGGFLTGSLSVSGGTSYTVTVGAGGGGAPSGGNGIQGGNGGNSVFSSITATGGGTGGCYRTTLVHGVQDGTSGGSGGGGGPYESSNGACGYAGYGGSGTNGQGYAGAAGAYAGGGGGGASAAGTQGCGGSPYGNGGNGGNGTSSSITGTSVTYAGGGGGGAYGNGGGSAGTGGTGGGGAGAIGPGTVTSNPGTSNTGGGGGGGSALGNAGGNGGSGIVIISYSTTYKLAIATGTVSQTSAGGNYVFTFTGSGTITF